MTSNPSAGHSAAPRHIPVMLAEVLDALAPRDGGHYLDATFGAGGYTRAILEAGETHVLAVDRDPSAIAAGAALVDAFAPRLTLRMHAFGDLLNVGDANTGDIAAASFEGVVLDLGVSSMQLDDAGRGFSFMTDGPLDMRMSGAPGTPASDPGPSAAEVVNTLSEAQLANILYDLGEERRSRAIAAAIVKRRAGRPIERTGELVDIVASVLGQGRPDRKHPATRTFQALRIWVNDELGELARGLAAAEALLQPGGRLVVVAFHSLEDRIVKRFIAERCGRTAGVSRHVPSSAPGPDPSFRIVNPKPLSPTEDEITANPRSRSARLRMAERTGAAAWGFDRATLDLPRVMLGR